MRRIAGAVICVMILAGCSTIPTSGPIQLGAEIGTDQADQVIRVIARPPQANMTPLEIVSGFLQASASFDDDHAVAREYLSPEASVTWDPASGIVVYDGVPTLASNGPSAVDMTATQVGSITTEGRYQVAPTGRLIRASFGLEFVGGEWRIASPPAGLLLARSDVDRAFRSYDVYFLDPTFTTLVPDPRLIPLDGPGVPTSLLQALTTGPTEWLAPAVRTGLPDGAGLAVQAVPVVDGVALVDLDPAVRLVDDATRRALSAQLAWTLRQVPGIRAIDLNAGGQVLPVSGVPNPQPVDAWSTFDPNRMVQPVVAYGVVAGRVVTVGDDAVRVVPGAAGLADPPLDGIAISLEGTQVAALDAEATIWRGRLDAAAAIAQVVVEPGESRPSFGRGTAVWSVGSDGLLTLAPEGGTTLTVPVDGLPTKTVLESVAVSRDGTRAAMIVRRGPRSFVMLGVIVLREGTPSIQNPVRTENRLTAVSDVAWADDDRLAVVGAEGAASPQVYEIDLSRWQLRALGAPPEPLRVAAAPGAPIVVASGDGYLYAYVNGPWRQVVRATSPAYPGS